MTCLNSSVVLVFLISEPLTSGVTCSMANTEKNRAPGVQTLDELGFAKLQPWLKTFKLIMAELVPHEDDEDAPARKRKVDAMCKSKFFSYAGAMSIAAVGDLPGNLLEGPWDELEKGMIG